MDGIIVNKNVKCRIGGRKAPVMSADDFVELLHIKLGNDTLNDIWDVMECLEEYDKIWKDIQKIDISYENFSNAYGYSSSILTYLDEDLPVLMTKSGIPFLLCSGNGDWEVPIVFMVYWDGKTFRGYIPSKGNCYNLKTKAAFGNNDELDTEYIKQQGYPYYDIEENFEDIIPHIDMCIEDFESRVEAYES